MGYETDDRMRRFVNNSRRLFLDSLLTDLFLEEFPGLHTGTRERIRCRYRNEGNRAANSMLIDEIMRLEDFASIFIKFCETYKILPNLVEHMEDELLRRPRNQRRSVQSSTNRRENGESRASTRTDGARASGNAPTNPNISEGASSPQPQTAFAERPSLSSSFFLNSSEVQRAIDADGGQSGVEHELCDLKLGQPSEPQALMPNIPPSRRGNAQSRLNTGIQPSKYTGVQCEEDVQQFGGKASGKGVFFPGGDGEAPLDPDETFPKSTVEIESRDGRSSPSNAEKHFPTKKEVTYFDSALLRVTEGTSKTSSKASSHSSASGNLADRASSDVCTLSTDPPAPGVKSWENNTFSPSGHEDSGTDVESQDSEEVAEPGGASAQQTVDAPNSSSVSGQEPSAGTNDLTAPQQEDTQNERKSLMATDDSETENETDSENDLTDSNPEGNLEEHPPPALGIGELLSLPVRAVSVAVNGVGTLLRSFWRSQ